MIPSSAAAVASKQQGKETCQRTTNNQSHKQHERNFAAVPPKCKIIVVAADDIVTKYSSNSSTSSRYLVLGRGEIADTELWPSPSFKDGPNAVSETTVLIAQGTFSDPESDGMFRQKATCPVRKQKPPGSDLDMPLVAPYRAILRYYRCDTHIAPYFFKELSSSPKWCNTPPCYFVSHMHICAIPHFATYHTIFVR